MSTNDEYEFLSDLVKLGLECISKNVNDKKYINIEDPDTGRILAIGFSINEQPQYLPEESLLDHEAFSGIIHYSNTSKSELLHELGHFYDDFKKRLRGGDIYEAEKDLYNDVFEDIIKKNENDFSDVLRDFYYTTDIEFEAFKHNVKNQDYYGINYRDYLTNLRGRVYKIEKYQNETDFNFIRNKIPFFKKFDNIQDLLNHCQEHLPKRAKELLLKLKRS